MKRINRKGFTLIELLAVIVILAIIVVVTVPTILNSINDSKVSSIHSLAKKVAHSYDTMVAQDLLSSDKKLEGISVPSSWTCIGNVGNLVSILDLPINDLNIGASIPGYIGNDGSGINWNGGNPPSDIENYLITNTCSCIRLVNGKAEVVLVAKAGGKFDVSGKLVYAFSSSDKGVQRESNN